MTLPLRYYVTLLLALFVAYHAPAHALAPQQAGARLYQAAITLEMRATTPDDATHVMRLLCDAAGEGDGRATRLIVSWLLDPNGPEYQPGLAAQWLRRSQGAHIGLPACPLDHDTALMKDMATLPRLISLTALQEGVDSRLVRAVIQVESAFRPKAVSQRGAVGLMQLMPGTAQDVGTQDRFDIADNIRGGTRYLASLLRRYNNVTGLALAAYNAGPAPVDKCLCIPPILETRHYVQQVLSAYATMPLHPPSWQ